LAFFTRKLRKMPGGGSFGRAAVAIEAIHRKKTRRQLKIEHKEFAAQQIEREEQQDIENRSFGLVQGLF
jgi:hypothetical protein